MFIIEHTALFMYFHGRIASEAGAKRKDFSHVFDWNWFWTNLAHRCIADDNVIWMYFQLYTLSRSTEIILRFWSKLHMEQKRVLQSFYIIPLSMSKHFYRRAPSAIGSKAKNILSLFWLKSHIKPTNLIKFHSHFHYRWQCNMYVISMRCLIKGKKSIYVLD